MGRRTDGGEAPPKAPASPRGAILVLLVVLLSLPVALEVLDGRLDTTSAFERLGVAVALSWAAVGGIGHLVDTYRARNALSRPGTRPAAPDGGAGGPGGQG